MLPVLSIKRISTATLLALTFAASMAPRAAEVTIDNTRLASEQTYHIEGSIFAFRNLTNAPFGETGREAIAIPKDVIMESVLSFGEIKTAFSESGLDESTVTIHQLRDLIAGTSYDDDNLFVEHPINVASLYELSSKAKAIPLSGVVVPKDPVANELTTLVFNASTVTNLVAAGAFVDLPFYGQSTGYYVLGEQESEVVRYLASSMYHLSAYRNDLAGEAFAELLSSIRRYDSLAKSFLAYIGRITFGLPIPSRAEEIGLVVPDFIGRNFDVYWVEFTVTYREMADDDLAEMVFNVSLPLDFVVLELIPVRYGPSAKITETESSPEFTVKLGEAEVSVGEFFGNKVSYSVIRPTIIGYGKGENVVSWSLHDEAVSAGSHTFVTIIGTPKGREVLPLAMTAHVRTQGVFGMEGKIAGTEVEALELALP